jgi:hypothetical protein
MISVVARFILAEGPAEMWGQIHVARAADPKSGEATPIKVALKILLAKVTYFYLTFSLILLLFIYFYFYYFI